MHPLPHPFFDSSGNIVWTSVIISVFSVAFLIAGLTRIVEFSDVGLGKVQRRFLIVLHVIGCVLFSVSMALAGIDIYEIEKRITTIFFFTGVGILLPLHIYLGLKRRIRKRDLTEE